MNIVLFGSTDISLSVAVFLKGAGYRISAIVTTSPTFRISYNPAGVRNSRYVDMMAWAHEHKIPAFLYKTADELICNLQEIDTDFAIVAGWHHMVPKRLRDVFPQGCAGFHASLLPAYRGGAPLNWSLLAGDKETGVSFFELSDGVDDGALYAQETFPILPSDYIGDLVSKSEGAILKMLADYMPTIIRGQHVKYPQEGTPSYCGQRCPEDSLIDWHKTASDLVRLVRASAKPYSGAYSFLEGQKVTIWRAAVSDIFFHGVPGQIILADGAVHVICGEGALKIEESESGDLILSKENQKRFSSI